MNNNEIPSHDKINDLIDMIDNLMDNGGGHINIVTDDSSDELSVQTYICSDCGCGKSGNDKACEEPTLFHGIDDDSDVE